MTVRLPSVICFEDIRPLRGYLAAGAARARPALLVSLKEIIGSMPKSSPAELSALREEVFARDGWLCVWPGCPQLIRNDNPIQLAHLTHRGMGGSKDRNTPGNCVTLCQVHHDCLDGRTGLGTLRLELNQMLRSVVGITVDTP